MNNGLRLNGFVEEAFRGLVANPEIVVVTSFRDGIVRLQDKRYDLCVSDAFDFHGFDERYFSQLGTQERVILFASEIPENLDLARKHGWDFFSRDYGAGKLTNLIRPSIRNALSNGSRSERLFKVAREQRKLDARFAHYVPSARSGVNARQADYFNREHNPSNPFNTTVY